MSSSTIIAKVDLLKIYKQLLRGCQTYPSKNRLKIYDSVKEDFRMNMNLDPSSEKAKQQVQIAYKGLSQVHQFDNRSATNFSVSLEQNPFPKPDNYEDERTKAVDKVLADAEADSSTENKNI